MATILFQGTEFNVDPELTAGRVLGAACMRYGDAGDVYRFVLIDGAGRTLKPSELVGDRRLALRDVRTLHTQREIEELRYAAAGK